MISNSQLVKKLRELDFQFQRETKRVHIYRRRGSADHVTFNMRDQYVDVTGVSILKQAGMAPNAAVAWCEDVAAIEQSEFRRNRKYSQFGQPDMTKVTTTTIESHNMMQRHYNRRWARRTIAFSRKLRNKRAAMSLFSTYFNFCRIAPGIRVSPAMEAGLTDHLWGIEELIEALNVEQSRMERPV